MHLQGIHINNFRNYAHSEFCFSEGINVVYGANGSGKTNLLDAVYYLCVGKSYFNGQDANNVKHNEGHFFLKGNFISNNSNELITVAYRLNDVKVITHNAVKYEKISAHTGRFPVVVIDPDDTLLVVDGSEERRRLFDNILSQADSRYLEVLMLYNKVLQQRNSYLKQFSSVRIDEVLLDTLDTQLHQHGHLIHEYRNEILKAIDTDFNRYYEQLSGGKESTSVQYQSDLNQADLIQLLKGSRNKDLEFQRTTVGIHRDDFIISLNEKLLKKAGSQGQKKTAIVALKLSLYRYIYKQKDVLPVLVLDDVFDKLDSERMHNLLKRIDSDEFGQVLISDTEAKRIEQSLTESHKKLHYIYLS